MSVRFIEQEINVLPDTVKDTQIREGASFSFHNRLWFYRDGRLWSCEDTPESRVLTGRILENKQNETENTNEYFRNMLNGMVPFNTSDSIPGHSVSIPQSCYIILFRLSEKRDINVMDNIRPIAPLEKNDLLIEYSKNETVLIKEGTELQETCEFTYALLDSIHVETGIKLTAGISMLQTSPSGWHDGFIQAVASLDIGRTFRMTGNVFAYSELVLERVLYALPEEFKSRLLTETVHDDFDKVFNRDTTETAEAFFESDLSLSDTARQMFIHRNTLTYRLEKIKKETGFDLRRFKDAVAFKSIMTLAASETEKGKK